MKNGHKRYQKLIRLDARFGSNSEVLARKREVCFALRNRHGQPGASGLKSATNGSAEVSEDMQINIPHGQHPAHG